MLYWRRELEFCQEDQRKYTLENFAKLSQKEKNLHQKAFANNINDPHYHELTDLKYKDGNEEREMKVPKGDVLFQFREDVKSGKLPTVSWLVAPENFSDHPGAPWYGAWYLSETMDILTQNPEVWKKTIFILCYDENDGYFDHVPPFVPPVPNKPESGSASKSIDLQTEYVPLERDLERKPAKYARGGPIGLGYRVPLVIASPWSRGGAVCSQTFDHTSILQLLEKFLSHKTGKKIEESNISAWRRAVCGDLTSAFKPYNGEKLTLPTFLERDEFVESIHKAQFKQTPSGFRALSKDEVEQANRNAASPLLMKQEKGTRTSRPLPYELYADGHLSNNKKSLELKLSAGNKAFGKRAAGSAFQVYGPGKEFTLRNYAVTPGDSITDSWGGDQFDNGNYHLKVYSPNGFFREFKGSVNDPLIQVGLNYEAKAKNALTGNIQLSISNKSNESVTVEIKDNAYHASSQSKKIVAGESVTITLNLKNSFGWYDTSVFINGKPNFENRFAGRVETGNESVSDPSMG
ncbi:MAG TPA: alkaline phosphatase family protein [Cyclobacteriaceae bacterium]